MNRVFYAMVVIAFATATWSQLTTSPPADATDWVAPVQAMSNALFDNIKAAVMTIVLPLVGAMAFFLGLMKVAERAGAMTVIAKLLRPLMVRLFPDVPANHPAMSAMILNISANALGLGNAATPFGIRAMQELDKLNGEKGTATNAMCLFLAINTSGIALLPTGVIAIRQTLGSQDAAGILPTTLFATTIGMVGAIVTCKVFERFASPAPPAARDDSVTTEALDAYPLWVSLLAMGLFVAMVPVSVVYGREISPWIVPLIVVGFLTWGMAKGVPVYETFVEGAKDGFETGVRIIPYLVAILGVIGMMRGSGAIEALSALVEPVTLRFGMPAEAVPMALLRPLSGSGANGLMMSTMQAHGPDSYVGYLVSTLQGSSETTFYVLAVYFGAVGVKRIRHAMATGLVADVYATALSVIGVQLYFTYNGLW